MIEKIGLQVNLTVRDRNDVRRNVCRNVTCLGFDDRKGSEGSIAGLLGKTSRTLEQTAVEIKDIAGIGFAAGWALKEQGYLTVGVRVLREVVKNNESVHAIVHEPLTHGCA